MNLALIVAGGQGTRMGHPGGKQLMMLAGKPVLAYTLSAFEAATTINRIILVTAEENIDACRALTGDFAIGKVASIVTSGPERQDSVYNGLEAAGELGDIDVVVVHDGARPLVTPAMIDTVARAVGDGCDGLIVGIPAKDTIKLVRDGLVVETLDRSQVWQVQTPQAFRYGRLLEAHERARADGFYGTDDAMLVERSGGVVKVVLGSDENIKITTPTDVTVAEALLAARSK